MLFGDDGTSGFATKMTRDYENEKKISFLNKIQQILVNHNQIYPKKAKTNQFLA